jgi:hypothetical protein
MAVDRLSRTMISMNVAPIQTQIDTDWAELVARC